MNLLKNFWFLLKKKITPQRLDRHTRKKVLFHQEHDEKLIQKLASNKKLPSLKQLKYFNRFLKPKEKLLLKTLLIILTISFSFVLINSFFIYSDQKPKIGGKYTEGLIGSPQYINPILSTINDVDSDLTSLLFSGLIKYDPEKGLIPDITKNYTISEDQKTYTFTLKNNLKWHDGETLDADDVQFTINSIMNPNSKSPFYFNFQGVTFQKIDNTTFKFILKEPFSPFLESLTFGILPEHIWRNIEPENLSLAEYNLKPIGNGPFKFKSLTKDKKGSIKTYSLERNTEFHNQPPYIEELNFKFFSSFEEAIEALNNKIVEGLSYLPKELQKNLINTHRLTINNLSLPQYTALFFNQNNNSLLKDINIKKALSLSINKNELISDVLNSESDIIEGPILPGNLGYKKEFIYNYTPEEAKKILTDNNWLLADYETKTQKTKIDKETGEEITEEVIEKQPFQIRKKNNTYLEFNLTTVNQSENVEIAEQTQKFWQQVGIKINLTFVSPTEIKNILKNRNYEILLYGEILGYDPDPYPFWHSSQINHPGLNLSLFKNTTADQLLETARKTNENQKKEEAYQKFQDIIKKEIPAIFLFNPKYSYPQTIKIKGLNTNKIITPANRFANVTNWYIKTSREF